jgi:hypothetical protein
MFLGEEDDSGEVAEISKGKPILIIDSWAVASVSYLAYDPGVGMWYSRRNHATQLK